MDDYTSKPIEPEELLEKIQQWALKGENVMLEEKQANEQSGLPADNPGTQSLDLKKAIERTMGDTDFLRDMLEQFLAEIPGQVDELRIAIEQDDGETLRSKAHALKGSAANLSAEGIAADAQRLEQIGRDGNLAEGEEALSALNDNVARLKNYVSQIDWAEVTDE